MHNSFTNGAQTLSGVDAFLRVAAYHSFRRAADELGISPSAVSQQVRTLEQRLGVPLLNRTTRSVGLTQAGQVFLARAAPAMAGLQQAFEETRNLVEPAGLLRLHVPAGALAMLIEPILRQFCAAYPRIDLEVMTDHFVPDLIAAGFDAGVQLGELLDADAIALRLGGPIRFIVVGTPAYLRDHGTPTTPLDLRDHQCIALHIGNERTKAWTFVDGERAIHVPISGRVSSDDYALCISAAMKGLGLFLVAENVVADAIAAGDLRAVLEPYASTSDGLFLHYPNRTHAMPKLRAFIDFLRNHLDHGA